MYRQYEDPRALQKMVEQAQEKYNRRIAEGADEEERLDLYNDIEDLKERENFAWQDEEYEENYLIENNLGQYASIH